MKAYQTHRFSASKIVTKFFILICVFTANHVAAQTVIEKIVQEETKNSQLQKLAHELLDGIGPRLVGTPQMKKANDWAVDKYASWGISARNEQWGEWKGWERGITHIDMLSPRVKSLEGTQLSWSPSTKGKAVKAEIVIIPDLADSLAFVNWLPTVKGKFVMISMNQPTGRPDDNWQQFATKESFDKLKKERTELTDAWRKRLSKTGHSSRMLPIVLEKAGALGILTNNWSNGFGVDKIFNAYTTKIPTVDIALEDYGTLYTDMNGIITNKVIPSIPGNYGVFYEKMADAILNNAPVPTSAKEGTNIIRVLEAARNSAFNKSLIYCLALKYASNSCGKTSASAINNWKGQLLPKSELIMLDIKSNSTQKVPFWGQDVELKTRD
mgnify:CR=1 FL=1